MLRQGLADLLASISYSIIFLRLLKPENGNGDDDDDDDDDSSKE